MPDGLAPDPNDKDSLGRTAMHLAAWAGLIAVSCLVLCIQVGPPGMS
jgi:ankyrin repeat protein